MFISTSIRCGITYLTLVASRMAYYEIMFSNLLKYCTISACFFVATHKHYPSAKKKNMYITFPQHSPSEPLNL